MWAKNSTFNGYDIYFDAANPISGKGIQLRSPTLIYIYFSGRVQKRYFEPFFSIHVIHVITNLGIG